MKLHLAFLATLFASACAASGLAPIVVAGLSIEQTACVLAQAELGASDPAAIQVACAISKDLGPEIVGLLAAKKEAAKQVAAAKAAKKADAGAK